MVGSNWTVNVFVGKDTVQLQLSVYCNLSVKKNLGSVAKLSEVGDQLDRGC